jgi:hypothetical protein
VVSGNRTQFALYDRNIDRARESLDDERLPPGLSLPAALLLSGVIWATFMAIVYVL